MEQCFILEDEILDNMEKNLNNLTAKFVHIDKDESLEIQIDINKSLVQIRSDNIELISEMIQDMAQYMNINELETQGKFPREMQNFKKTLKEVEDFKKARMNVTADIADSVQLVKTYIVKAEDSRMVGDMQYMKKYYTEVMVQNRNLITEL